MRYRYGRGVTKKPKQARKVLLALPVLFVGITAYVGINLVAPKLAILNQPPDTVANKVTTIAPGGSGDRLFLPQINVEVPIHEAGTPEALKQGAWLRNPSNGTPDKGGHVALSARRFLLGITPASTKIQSPFYHLDELSEGDEIFLDYHGVRYVYEITKTYHATRSVGDIETPSTESKLTLYTYGTTDTAEERGIIEATSIGTVIWSEGKPSVRPLDVW